MAKFPFVEKFDVSPTMLQHTSPSEMQRHTEKCICKQPPEPLRTFQ